MITTAERAPIHESAHCCVAALHGAKPFSLSLDGDGESGGRMHYPSRAIYNSRDARVQMRILLAGVAGERIAFDEPHRQPFGSDSSEVWKLARNIHGLDADPDTIQAEVDEQLAAVEVLLRQHWPQVVALADASSAWFEALNRFRWWALNAGEVEIEEVPPSPPAPPALAVAASTPHRRATMSENDVSRQRQTGKNTRFTSGFARAAEEAARAASLKAESQREQGQADVLKVPETQEGPLGGEA